MEYLAHICEYEGEIREQSVLDHLKGTAELAEQFAAVFGYGDWGYCCGMMHDIGKYSDAFQRRIREGSREEKEEGPRRDVRVDHATAGARVCKELADRGEHCGYFAVAYCIAGHHAGLADYGGSADEGTSSSFCGRMKKQLEHYGSYEKEVAVPVLRTPMIQVTERERACFSCSFFIRMLYSCLVDADYLDTEAFMLNGEIERRGGEDMEALWRRLYEGRLGAWLQNEDRSSLNGRRTYILRHCIEEGCGEKGIFRMTVPTGGGKTIASLSFALRHAVEHGLRRVIYVIPYTSIIEQNAQVFREILGDENVLEHHSGVDYEGTEEFRALQLATENWDAPVVVTTNVQFFESLFAHRSSRCRKLHNIAGSVIIFDEAQMLPMDYLKPCVAAIEELVEKYGCSAVLCSATQPALQGFFAGEWEGKELCPEVEDQFAFFKRTHIQVLGKIGEEELAERLKGEKSVLCILNTKKEVQQLYEQVKGEGVFHLSTSMYPIHRKKVLGKIKERLKQGRCIVISTSLMEAGVDLDFQTVYRQLAGIDSIIQAAGRSNREGKRPLEESHTYVFWKDGSGKAPGQEQQIDTARGILREFKEDVGSLEAIQAYFEDLYDFKRNGLDKKRIMEQIRDGGWLFRTIGRQFQLIEENTKSILITREEEAEKLLEELRRACGSSETEGPGISRRLMRAVSQYCVNVYENHFRQLDKAGMLLPVANGLPDFYLLRDKEYYTEEQGLQMKNERGVSIFM